MPIRAQRLRKNPTPAEIRLWRLIGPLRLGGFHFRKEVPIGPFVVDFACHHAGLVIEVDGDTHFDDHAITKDKMRDAFIANRGYRILRFTNLDLVQQGEGVYDMIAGALAAAPEPLHAR